MHEASLNLKNLFALLFCDRVNKICRYLFNNDVWLIDTVQEMYQLLMTGRRYVLEGTFH